MKNVTITFKESVEDSTLRISVRRNELIDFSIYDNDGEFQSSVVLDAATSLALAEGIKLLLSIAGKA